MEAAAGAVDAVTVLSSRAVNCGADREGLTVRQLYSHRARMTLPAYRYRFRQALKHWVVRPKPQSIPRGQLVLLADGLWFEFDGIPWVLYLMAVEFRSIQAMVREFLSSIAYYRAYLAHPDLRLPHTTNSAESMCRLLREVFRSSRAGSNPDSVLLWATTLLRLRSTVVCNDHPINKIS
jgi:hypothetical protein